MRGEPRVNVLLVEDNPLDVRATIRAAEQLDIASHFEVVGDGHTALERLQRTVRPDLVLMDLDLPGLDGRDVLQAMQRDPALRPIPVVVLTTSSDDADVLKAYELGANAFVTKPAGIDSWFDMVRRIESFWISLVRLPPR